MEYRQSSQKLLCRYQPPLLAKQNSTDKLAQKLLARNQEMEEYARLQERLARLEEQYTQLNRQAVSRELSQEVSKGRMNHESRQAEHTAQELRSSIEMKSAQVKSLTIRLNDLLGEADELASLKASREAEIAELNLECTDLREVSQKLQQDRSQLQSDRGTVEGELKQTEQRLAQLDRTTFTYRERSDKINSLIVELQLACERISKHIEQYEKENNAIDADVQQLILRESEQQAQIDDLNQLLKESMFCISELESDQKGLQNVISQGRAAAIQ